jgi:hypothetical protein
MWKTKFHTHTKQLAELWFEYFNLIITYSVLYNLQLLKNICSSAAFSLFSMKCCAQNGLLDNAMSYYKPTSSISIIDMYRSTIEVAFDAYRDKFKDRLCRCCAGVVASHSNACCCHEHIAYRLLRDSSAWICFLFRLWLIHFFSQLYHQTRYFRTVVSNNMLCEIESFLRSL